MLERRAVGLNLYTSASARSYFVRNGAPHTFANPLIVVLTVIILTACFLAGGQLPNSLNVITLEPEPCAQACGVGAGVGACVVGTGVWACVVRAGVGADVGACKVRAEGGACDVGAGDRACVVGAGVGASVGTDVGACMVRAVVGACVVGAGVMFIRLVEH